MFRIWIGNLRKYTEGELFGEWVDLPCYELDKVVERIGANDNMDEYGECDELFIADSENDYGYDICEYDNIYVINEVAETLEGLDDRESDIWVALHDDGYNHEEIMRVLESGDYADYENCDDMGDVARELYGHEADRLSEALRHNIDWDGVGEYLESIGEWHDYNGVFVEVY